MLSKLLTRPVVEDFVVIDHLFPQKNPFAFKNTEINEYFKRVKNFASYTMYPMLPDNGAWFTHGYGISYEEFMQNKSGYVSHYPDNEKRIKYLWPNKKYKIKLAYTYFLAETYVLLPFLEKNEVPFIFVLYPGGGFGLNNEKSDYMLQRIFRSKCFRGIITTQELTRQYLLDRNLCPTEQISHIYGGFVQFKKDDVLHKRYYRKDKKTFDICFVAAKYSERGVDKGYDLFIEIAKRLAKKTNDIRFHVIGGFDESEIDIGGLADRIIFYGYKKPDFLIKFYRDMDIFLAPNRPFKLFEGNFDGFPLGIDAAYCGVALFVADELKMNRHYIHQQDIEIIGYNAEKTVSTIMDYYETPNKLYALASLGEKKTQTLFDTDMQINERLKVFGKSCRLQLR